MELELEHKKVIDSEIAPMLQSARSLIVKDNGQRNTAVSIIKKFKDFKEKIEERFKPTANKEKAYKVYKDLIETEKAFYEPIDESIKIITSTVKQFDTTEAIRVQMEQEEAEAKRKDEEEKQREKLNEKAQKAEDRGDLNKAETLREQAENVTVLPKIAPPIQPVKKLIWKAKVTNLFLLCKAIASGQVPFSVVEVRQSALNDFAKNYDGKTKIEGIEFVQDVSGRV